MHLRSSICAIALLLMGCQPLGDALTLVGPDRLTNDGMTANLRATAFVGETPGEGSVSFSAEVGDVAPATVPLENGRALSTWRCNVATTSACTGPVVLTAKWNKATATKLIRLVEP